MLSKARSSTRSQRIWRRRTRDAKALEHLGAAFPSSGGARALTKEIKATGNVDGKRQQGRLQDILARCGYVADRKNKHLVLVHSSGCATLQLITLHNTPSDRRATKNLASQINKALDLKNL